MGKMSRFVVSALLLLALQVNVALAASHLPLPTGEVLILLERYDNYKWPIAALEKTSVDKWGGYKAGGHYSKDSEENQTIRFYPVPYGTFRVWIGTSNCGVVEGNFSFGEGVKKTEITFDAQACRFTTYGFSS